MPNRLLVMIAVVAALGSLPRRVPAADAELTAAVEDEGVVIRAGDQPVATYVFRDAQILRPYYTQVHAPGGVQVTRTHPPQKVVDAIDHDTMHPGIWLAFGDLGGADFWRNKGRVEHVEFALQPGVHAGVVRFAARNRYLVGEKQICRELARYSLRRVGPGYLLTLDCEFSGDEPFAFGDQEEMGLGLRLATPLTVKQGTGSITNNAGGKNEKEVWGRPADWCDYGGATAGGRAGLLVLPHPDNFRRSWMHVRDYGLMVANPFGRRAFTQGEASRIEVKPGENLRLRFGVLAYAAVDAKLLEPAKLRDEYVRISTAEK